MLDQINKIIGDLTSQIGGEHGISKDNISKVTETSKESIIDTIKSAALDGKTDQIMGLFEGKGGGALQNDLINNLIKGLTSKAGLGKDLASGFAGSLIPKLIEMFASKGKDGLNVTDLISVFMGGGKKGSKGNAGDILENVTGMLGGLFGKK